eukprot:scaffold1253_cov245-Pinguiococcus_pyrenoidosus.AAC.11
MRKQRRLQRHHLRLRKLVEVVAQLQVERLRGEELERVAGGRVLQQLCRHVPRLGLLSELAQPGVRLSPFLGVLRRRCVQQLHRRDHLREHAVRHGRAARSATGLRNLHDAV